MFGTPQGPKLNPLGLGDTQTRPVTVLLDLHYFISSKWYKGMVSAWRNYDRVRACRPTYLPSMTCGQLTAGPTYLPPGPSGPVDLPTMKKNTTLGASKQRCLQ